jgi:3'-5' exoribonuclease
MGESRRTTVLVQGFEVRKTKRGENFGALTLNLGQEGDFAPMAAKIWQYDRFVDSGREAPDRGSIVEIAYKEDEFGGAPQWTVLDYRVLNGKEAERARERFVQPARIAGEYYRAKLDELIDRTDPKRVSGQIVRDVFDRRDFRERFYAAPSAMTRHQNYPGGLLEHTLNVTLLALTIADAYADGNRPGLTFNSEFLPVDGSLLIAAGLLHDIGKIETYEFTPAPDVTDANRFEGHLPISYAAVRERARPLRERPPYAGAVDEIDKLLNCILSHHGALEFGSPVMPACVEAVILAQADVTDARLAEIVTEGNRALRRNPQTRFISSKAFAGGVFVGDWPPPPAPT